MGSLERYNNALLDQSGRSITIVDFSLKEKPLWDALRGCMPLDEDEIAPDVVEVEEEEEDEFLEDEEEEESQSFVNGGTIMPRLGRRKRG